MRTESFAQSAEDKVSKKKTPYLPRFTYQFSIEKTIAFNKFQDRPCSASKFGSEGLGIKSAGTARTILSCLAELGWITRVETGLYDMSEMGRKIARASELGATDEEVRLAKQTIDNVESLRKLLNHFEITKKKTFDEIKSYVATTWGHLYNFKPDYLDDITRYILSYLEAAKMLDCDPNSKTYRVAAQPAAITDASTSPEKPMMIPSSQHSHESPSTKPALYDIPVRINVEITDHTDIEELRKKVREVKKMLQEESKGEENDCF